MWEQNVFSKENNVWLITTQKVLANGVLAALNMGSMYANLQAELNMGWKWNVLTKPIPNQLSLSLSGIFFVYCAPEVYVFRNSSSPLKNRKDKMSEDELHCRLPTATRISSFRGIEMIGPSACHRNLTLDMDHLPWCLQWKPLASIPRDNPNHEIRLR